MLDVALGAREKVVEADDVVPRFNQPVAQMRADESGAAGHQDGFAIERLFGCRASLHMSLHSKARVIAAIPGKSYRTLGDLAHPKLRKYFAGSTPTRENSSASNSHHQGFARIVATAKPRGARHMTRPQLRPLPLGAAPSPPSKLVAPIPGQSSRLR